MTEPTIDEQILAFKMIMKGYPVDDAILATLERVKQAEAGLPVEPEYAEACEFDNEDSVVSRIEYDALRGHIIRVRAESAQTCRLGCTENCGSCVPTKAAEAGLPVEPETFKFAIDIDTPVAYVVLKDDYDTLRDYAVQSDVAVKIHAKDVFNLTEKVIPNIRERAEKADALAEQNRKDAERYRWLREQHEGKLPIEMDADGFPMPQEVAALAFTVFYPDPTGDESLVVVPTGNLDETIDAAIDSARAE